MPEEPATPQPAPRQLFIEYRIPDDAVPQYATNALVQHTEHEFLLYFFNIRPPVIVGTPEDQAQKIQALTTVPANMIGFITMTPAHVIEFIQLLVNDFKSYQDRFGPQAETMEEDTDDSEPTEA